MSDENTMGNFNKDPNDPLSELLRRMGLDGVNAQGQGIDLNALLAQLQQAVSQVGPQNPSASGIDWDATKRATQKIVSSLGPDPSPSPTQHAELADADRLAESWLDPVTEFAAPEKPAQAWNRSQWVDDTMDSWRHIVEPIVTAIADAMSSAMGQQAASEVPELAQLTGMLAPMLRVGAGQMYSGQLAESIGHLAAEIVSGSEIGIQLMSAPGVVMLPTNAQEFVRGLELPDEDALMYLTVREAARQRLFAHVTWLGPQLLALIEHYAREITIDMDAINDAIEVSSPQDLTPDRLQELSKQLQGKLFTPARTPEQLEVLQRLETLLALVEGWVDTVAHNAAAAWLPQEEALLEAIRRRRATNGPAEKVFSSLVGLELHPRRVREAQHLWQAIEAQRGTGGRDAVWAHPDLIPTAADLDDPIGFSMGERADDSDKDWDSDLRKLLESDGGESKNG